MSYEEIASNLAVHRQHAINALSQLRQLRGEL